jgi:hypothetical protein
MIQNKFFTSLAVFCCFLTAVPKADAQTIISDLETSKAGEGAVRIVCDPKIIELLGKPTSSPPPEINDETQPVKLTGYRIQIFMDNSQGARTEAARIVGLMNETFPKIPTYVRYNAPNWRVLIGDFLTKEEADTFRQTMQRSLPGVIKEVYIIPSKINPPEK